jgi:hypothetical protein
MNIAKWAALGTVALVAMAPTTVAADSYWEVEAARANARAGGPTNARDAELLERYGCLSGTRSSFCKRLGYNGGPRYYRARKYAR